MATEIGGLFTTPEQYQLAQQQQQQAQALQYAQLDPRAQANYGFFNAGQRLGGAIGGALGGEDPQLKLISQRQQLASQLDQSDPQSYLKLAQQVSQSDPQFAMALANAGRQAAIQVAQANKERQLAVPADIQKINLLFEVQDNIRKIQGLPDSPEKENALKILQERAKVLGGDTTSKVAVPLQVAQRISEISKLQTTLDPNSEEFKNLEVEKVQLQRPERPITPAAPLQVASRLREISIAQRQLDKNSPEYQDFELEKNQLLRQEKELTPNVKEVGVAETSRKPVYLDVVNDTQFTYEKGADGKQVRVPYYGGVDRTTAKVSATASSKQAEGVNKNKIDMASSIEESAFSASDRISLAQSLRELAPKAFTGFASDAKLTASKVASAFGIPTKGGSESEIIDQILGQMTLGSAGQLKGSLSDKDVLFLKKTIGTRGLSVNTLLFVADEIERLAAQDRHLNKQINAVTSSGKSLNDINFEEEKTKSAGFVKKQISEYRGLLGKVNNGTASLEEAKRAKQIRDELGLQQ